MGYLLRLLAATFLTVFVISGFQYAVDSYAFFDFPRIQKFNFNKVKVGNQEAEFKRKLAASGEFQNVVIGNSRVNVGFDFRAWPEGEGKIVNLGSGGQDIEDSFELLKLIAANPKAKLKNAFLFVDFSQVYQMGPGVVPLNKPIPGTYEFLAKYTFNLSNLKDAWETFEANFANSTSDVCKNNPFHLETGVVCSTAATEDAPLSVKASEEEKGMCGVYNFIQPRLNPQASTLVFLKQAVDFAKERQMQMKVVLAPLHPRHLTLIRRAGKWEDFQQFKRNLTAIAGEVWDFSYPNSHFEKPSDWVETTHFKPTLGALILQDLLYPQAASVVVRIHPSNIESHIAMTEERLSKWGDRNPADVAGVTQVCDPRR